MINTVYRKRKKKNIRKFFRFFGLGLSICGFIFGLYFFFPLISWEVYLRPVFATQAFASPIPKTSIITSATIQSLLVNTENSIMNFNNSSDWLPKTYKQVQINTQVSSYQISIPALTIQDAEVSTVDTDLDVHLVHFPGTAVPPDKGTAAIFGHSTLPQWFDPTNYKTIFATALNLQIGDTIVVSTDNTLYTYKIYDITIVDPDDTSYLTQQYDGSYLDIVTCTPPGTTWKRLVIKSKLET
jgi:sortase A